jgi:hypothetical protein
MSELKSVDVWIDDMSKSGHTFTSIAKDLLKDASIDKSIPIITRLGSEVPVQGQMVAAEMRLDANEAIRMDDIELKNRLITKLVRELMDGRYIEFTKQQDVTRMETVIRARIFVTPDDQVRVIRKATNV